MGAGYPGTAESAEPLDEEDEEVTLKPAESLGEAVQDRFEHVVGGLSEEGLSWFTKFIILAVIVGLCVGYVRMHSPRRTGHAGRHGAYEKGGLP